MDDSETMHVLPGKSLSPLEVEFGNAWANMITGNILRQQARIVRGYLQVTPEGDCLEVLFVTAPDPIGSHRPVAILLHDKFSGFLHVADMKTEHDGEDDVIRKSTPEEIEKAIGDQIQREADAMLSAIEAEAAAEEKKED